MNEADEILLTERQLKRQLIQYVLQLNGGFIVAVLGFHFLIYDFIPFVADIAVQIFSNL